jgi:subtilase family serine protease
VLESDETNNALAGNAINVSAPRADLLVLAVANPMVAKNGKPITLAAVLMNLGLDAAPASSVRWYLSTDTNITTADVPLGTAPVPAMGPYGFATASLSARVPATVGEGTYYIGAIIDPDNVVGETNNNNNGGLSYLPVTVRYMVDLVMTSVTGPNAGVTGQPITLGGVLKNKGLEAVTGEVTVGFYVSGDDNITVRDRLIGVAQVNGLAAGASVPVSTNVVLRTDLPKRDFYVGAIADPGNMVPELRNGNNELAALNLLSVTHGPDLVVASVAAPAEVARGSAFTVNATVSNQGTGEIGAASDQSVIDKGSRIEVGIYLSSNESITAGDLLVGTATFSNLGAGASVPLSANVTLPAGLPPGSYYIGAIADRSRVLREVSNLNNALAGNRLTVR